jgi:peptidoglycan/LPS O-acetylase OafA/YrhL
MSAAMPEAGREAQRFLALDAWRGVAALAVATMHANIWHRQTPWLPSGSLAVDFFFMLSGFVLAFAYGRRLALGGAGWWFVRERLIRLMPLVWLGAACGVAAQLAIGKLPPGMIGELFVFNLLAIPHPVPGYIGGFILNGPHWSLMVELLLSFGFAWLAPALDRRALALLIALSGCLYFRAEAICAMFDGMSGYPTQLATNLPRGVFSFSIGLLLFDLDVHRERALPWWACIPIVPLMLATFALGPAGESPNLYRGMSIALYAALIAFGSRVEMRSAAARCAAWLGFVSYPLYAIHRPLLQLLLEGSGWIERTRGVYSYSLRLGVMSAALVVIVSLAVVAGKFYDAPLRRALRRLTAREQTANPLPDPT